VTSFDIIHQDMGTQQTCLDDSCCIGLDTAYSVICLHAHVLSHQNNQLLQCIYTSKYV